MVVKVRLDLTLDQEKFEVDLATSRTIFPRIGIEKYINLNQGVNFRTSEGLLLSNLEDAPTTPCQRNSLVNQGRVTLFESQGSKTYKKFL